MREPVKSGPVAVIDPLDTSRGKDNSKESHCPITLPHVFTSSQPEMQIQTKP